MKMLQLIEKFTAHSVITSAIYTGVLILISFIANAQSEINPSITNLPQRPQNRIEIPPEILRMQQATVPRLIGREYNYDEIVTILDRAGLQIGEVVPVGKNDSIGIVTGQQPSAGQRVFPQTRVNISYGIEIPPEFSVQPDLVRVPGYIGLPLEQAESRMPNDRLDIGNIREEFSYEPPGIIIDQFPEPGMEVDSGTLISFVVSLGQPPQPFVEVPPIVGETLREAAEILREFGLSVGELTEEISNERAGIVLEQSPEAGTLVDENSPVNIVYSVPAELITVPDVQTLPRNEAISILNETGLNYLVKYQKNSNAAENTVIDQEPLPGNSVPPGSDVILLISEETDESWIYWGAGIVAAALAGGFAGRKIKTGRKNRKIGKKNMEFDLKPTWDLGIQQIKFDSKHLSGEGIQLKIKKDAGIQTIKTDKNEV